MDISIIIPVYNVEKYLKRCLDSIFSQYFSGSFEVIAVNDASTDNSLGILKKYQEKEKRLKIFDHNTNKKLSIARTTGMKAANGEYIMHVDSDDYLLPGALECVLEKINKTRADILVFNYIRELSNGEQIPINHIPSEMISTEKENVQKYFYCTCFNKVVKKEIVLDMVYGTTGINNTEDMVYSTEILLVAKTIGLFTESYYTYCTNPSSIVNTSRIETYLNNRITILNILSSLAKRYNDSPAVINNALALLGKNTFYDLMVYHLQKNKMDIDINGLISAFGLFTLYDKGKIRDKLVHAIEKKYYCMYQVLIYFGLYKCVSLVKNTVISSR